MTLGIIVLNAGFIGYNADYSARFEAPENLYDCTGFEPSECYQFIIFENFFADLHGVSCRALGGIL